MNCATLRRELTALEQWALPAECLLCREPIARSEGDALVCGVCRRRWRPLPEPVCDRCGQPARADFECRICAGWSAGLGRVRSAVWLTDGARHAVHQLKYEGWWRVAEAMALAMRGLEPLRGKGLTLVPVPLAARRQRQRGYNQSERIALELGRHLGLVVRPDLLQRVRETGTQTALTPEGRRANVAACFAGLRARGLSLVVVDDVFTTGATLEAAAAALVSAGAETVDAVTFARARLPVG